MSRQWFISDLHLAIERPLTLQRFECFLAERPQSGDRVFILGDLVDFWVGDDDDSELAERVRRALRKATDRGLALSLQRGNRDIIMGRRLMRDTGAEMLHDTHVTDVAGQRTLLMHGDLLCTDDVEYQKSRRWFSHPAVQWLLLRRSLAARRRLAERLRAKSREHNSRMPEAITDVNDQTVVRYLQRHRVHQLIHGHTHRPAIHPMRLPDGSEARRLVLPEWHEDRAIVWCDDGRRLTPVELGD